MGLRILAGEHDEPTRAEVLELAERLEHALAGIRGESGADHFAFEGVQGTGSSRAVLIQAARERRRCEIRYLKAGAAQPDRRAIDPYLLVAAGGFWYALARCARRDAVQAFRLDRIVGLEIGEERFQVPQGFDASDYLGRGTVYRAAGEADVVVRYSPAIARWILEKGVGDVKADGSVVLRHRVADPRWLVRHVLRHGRDAEVIEPPEYRQLVISSLTRMAREIRE